MFATSAPAGVRSRMALLPAVVVAAAAAVVPTALAPTASAASVCNNVEVVFARGTNEAPGAGVVGQAFVDSLRSQMGNRSMGVYAVDYPATRDFPTAVMGVDNAKAEIENLAASCPGSKVILGGYSQGAAVAELVTADQAPAGYDAGDRVPLTPRANQKIAAVALFGAPNERALGFLGEPYFTVSPGFQSRTIDLCSPNDPVCSDGFDVGAHKAYLSNGMTDQAAQFAIGQL